MRNNFVSFHIEFRTSLLATAGFWSLTFLKQVIWRPSILPYCYCLFFFIICSYFRIMFHKYKGLRYILNRKLFNDTNAFSGSIFFLINCSVVKNCAKLYEIITITMKTRLKLSTLIISKNRRLNVLTEPPC